MTIANTLVLLGGLIFVALGGLHALYSILDVRSPRRLAPSNDAARLAMIESTVKMTRGRTTVWDAWLGFNISHGVGAVIFGGLAMAVALYDSGALASGVTLLVLTVVGAIYFGLAIRFWFYLPVIGTGLAASCFVAALILEVVGS